METAVGTFRKCGRTSVRPAAVSRIAASRWPSKYASTAVNCQPGDGVRVQMPYCPPKKRTSSITLPVSCTPAMPEPMRKSMWARKRVLRVRAAHADRTRVALADLDVDVAHRRVERAGAGIGRTAVAPPRCRPRRGERLPARRAAGAPVRRRAAAAPGAGGKAAAPAHRARPHRRRRTPCSSRRSCPGSRACSAASTNTGPLRAVPDQPDRRPDVDGLRQPVAALAARRRCPGRPSPATRSIARWMASVSSATPSPRAPNVSRCTAFGSTRRLV